MLYLRLNKVGFRCIPRLTRFPTGGLDAQAEDNGLSTRFNDDFRNWLNSGIMNMQYSKAGNVYFHTSLKVGKGSLLKTLGLIGFRVRV